MLVLGRVRTIQGERVRKIATIPETVDRLTGLGNFRRSPVDGLD